MGFTYLRLPLIALLGALAGCGSETPLPDDVVAAVSGHLIPSERYFEALAALAVAERGPTLTPAHRALVLDELIDEALLLDRAAQLGLHPLAGGGPDRALLEAATATSPAPTETELRAYFADHRAAFDRDPSFRVEVWRFVGPDAEARADRAAHDLADGRATDAARLDVPSGALPFGALEQRIGPTGARATTALTPGEVSRPIRYASGWIVVRLVSRLPGRMPPYEEVAGAVRLRYRQDVERENRIRFLAALRSDADIEIHEAVRDAPIPSAALERAWQRERTGGGP